uniref:GP-PDE domain-containing protein n=1 Tax=Wuchereria bancrofti TaxID=6293 RepID=A0A1I8E9V1_WUCBA
MSVAPRTVLHFSVEVETVRPWEYVFVTGSLPVLGGWIPSNAFILFPDPDSARQRWEGEVEIGLDPVKFRYFIGYYLHSVQKKKFQELVVSKWESFLSPRSVLPTVESVSGVCHLHVTDKFGWSCKISVALFSFVPLQFHLANECIYDLYWGIVKLRKKNNFTVSAGKNLVSEASLMGKSQNEILLRFHGNPFKFCKKRYAERSYCIKVTPFDLRHREMFTYELKGRIAWQAWSCVAGSVDDDDNEENQDVMQPILPSYSVAHIAILSSDVPHYREQSPSGDRFKVDSDYFVFRTRSVAVEFLGFRIELFTYDEQNGPSTDRFAIAYALPSSFHGTFGVAGEPLLVNNRPVGQINVEYLFIRPLLTSCWVQKMDISYAKHWKKRQPLEVGHRGMGNSYTKMNAGRENTIHSLNTAAKRGADYVEFDVQLSKDKIAVIFHDFHVLVSVAKRWTPRLESQPPEAANDYHEIAVKDLRLKQLQLLRLEHYKAQTQTKQNYTKVSAEADEQDERLPFPTLIDALRQVDSSVGFNIEIKYPMMQKNGLHECENYFERNDYIDIILNDVLESAGDRRIVFSSFDPDCCALLAAKQHLYPVLFLCVGVTTRYEPFVDLRSSTSNSAVNFAACIDILGVNFHTEDLLRDPSPIQRARKLGLISFVWGDDLDNKENIDYFKKVLRVDGLIYDRIGEIETRRNVFLVEREAKASLFRQSNSPTTSRTVSLDEGPPSPTTSENSHSSGSTISSNNSFYLSHSQASFPARKMSVALEDVQVNSSSGLHDKNLFTSNNCLHSTPYP